LRPNDVGTCKGMSGEILFAMTGVIGLVVAVLTGALWDSPVANAPFRIRRHMRTEGRHAMR
jgi:hypothetical protein